MEILKQKLLLKVVFSLLAAITSAAYGGEFEDGLAAYDTRSYEVAFAAFNIASEQGVAKAQCKLGHMYENGQGVTKSDEQAMEWYRRAAEQDDAEAQ